MFKRHRRTMNGQNTNKVKQRYAVELSDTNCRQAGDV
jgi:hypothetical protein